MPASQPMSSDDRILTALFVLHENYNVVEPTKKRVAVMAKVSMASMPSLLSRKLKKPGFIEYGSTKDTIKLTKKGLDRAANLTPAEDMVTTNEQVHENIKKQLKGKALLIFNFLLDRKEHEKAEVMKAVKCENPKTFNPIVSRELKKHDIVEYPAKSTIRLNPAVCFPIKE